MHNCMDCGIEVKMPSHGFVHYRSEQQDAFAFVEYQNEKELLEILENHQDITPFTKVGLSHTEQPPLITSSYDQLLSRVRHKEVVETINNGNLVSFIQPIIDLKSNHLFGFESLLRTVGEPFIPPMTLFQVAEQTGLLSKLDKRAREAAIQTRANYIQPGLKSFINFLPSTIYNPDYCLQHTFQLVKKYRIDPNDLVFEVVETEKIVDVEHLQKVFLTYKKQGMKVALDDLGAGFSTVEMLELLRPDFVKIDRHYIDHCDTDREKQAFLTGVMNIAKDLHISVLAEGLERTEELEYCRELGVDLAQGYLVGRPTNAKDYFHKQ